MSTSEWFQRVKQIIVTGGPRNPAEAQALVFAIRKVEETLGSPESQPSSEELERLQGLLQERDEKLATLEVDVATLEEEKAELKKELRITRAKVTRLEKKIEES